MTAKSHGQRPRIPLRAQALAALATVYDPELDEPITTLGFVDACDVSADGDVAVRLRLPTPQCAPNFAFLMAADARDALRRGVPAAQAISVVLRDHYTGEEINAAVGRGGGFEDAFPGESDGPADLEALRELFQRKALLARQGRVAQALLAAGTAPEQVVAARVGDLPDTPDAHRCVQLRRELGLSCDADAPALVAGEDGAPIPPEQLSPWLRRARLVSLSLESNGGICRSLLQVRYGVEDPTEEGVAA
ncbi:iron-sulfur cluster assembly protein [Conexibacter sp. CPCC 206217]|uniref:iron-sulfur cluster assembly protein n=1 Tax=Conexibacter sp. CPCC 206217 TaxID=3064574 RepID=UPI00271EF82D|nr:iron-sulfur cluster assembly protein [Conexibacter sp. CPCC 206217]MDO8212469.1 iron-sulfur cluster assembly protein [Conexibacter sp. CPCC 206217]